jgi:uncharacterized protein YacL
LIKIWLIVNIIQS